MVDSYYSQTRSEMHKYLPQNAKIILDAGCGEGAFASTIKKERGCEVWGIEINPDAAEIARQRLDSVYCGDLNEQILNMPSRKFDAIFFNDVLEHLPKPETALTEAGRLLKPGGVVIASIPNMRYFPVLMKLVFKKDWKYIDSGILDKTHLRFFTRKSACRLFTDSGYDIISSEGLNSLPPKDIIPLNLLTLGYFNDTRYMQFAVVAQLRSNGVS